MTLDELKAAKARHEFKAAGGVVTKCPPGRAETCAVSMVRTRSQRTAAIGHIVKFSGYGPPPKTGAHASVARAVSRSYS